MIFKNLLQIPNIFWGDRSIEKDTIEKIINRSEGYIPDGQFSCVFEDKDYIYLIRDRLGLNKFFYHIDIEKRSLTISNYLYELACITDDYGSIYSVPAGHYIRVNKSSLEKNLVTYYDINERVKTDVNFKLELFHKKVLEKLENGFKFLQEAYSDHRFFVCLSGGLDSSLIADFASKYLQGKVSAVTFSYASEDTVNRLGSIVLNPDRQLTKDPLLSDDFRRALKIAKALSLPFVAVLKKREIELEILDEVIKNCQDWRDFNVHCAWVNYLIGKEIVKNFFNEKIVFLTGDLMNEYMADYTPVEYKAEMYYKQPRIPRMRLRNFFISGLDSGDREIGIFSKFGTSVIQPYSLLAELYLEVPSYFIEKDNCKAILNKPLLSNPELPYLISDAKVRSQVGGRNGGTLGLFHDTGITQRLLEKRWKQIFSKFVNQDDFTNIIFAGHYKS